MSVLKLRNGQAFIRQRSSISHCLDQQEQPRLSNQVPGIWDTPKDKPGLVVGDVGYRFLKHFEGHGVFEGRVVEILANAPSKKDRRCEYNDGDIEDLSLSDLMQLSRRNSNTTHT